MKQQVGSSDYFPPIFISEEIGGVPATTGPTGMVPVNHGQLVNQYANGVPPVFSDDEFFPDIDESVSRRRVSSDFERRLANNMINSRVPVERGSTTSPNAGLLGIRFPYVTIVRPKADYPNLYNEHMGRPTNVTDILGNFHGYTEVAEIHLDGVSATLPEKLELENLLKGGVIL